MVKTIDYRIDSILQSMLTLRNMVWEKSLKLEWYISYFVLNNLTMLNYLFIR